MIRFVEQSLPSPRPRWNGSPVLSGIVDAGRRVARAVPGAAPQDGFAPRHATAADLPARFEASPPRIEAAALVKSGARPEGAPGPVPVRADDLDPPDAAPPTGP